MNHTDPTAAEPMSVEERVARYLAAKDWLTTEDHWDQGSASFRANYLTHARELIALVQEPAVPVLVSPPPDREALRGRVAALFRCPPGTERLGDATPGEIADAVLAVLPESGRAAVEAERDSLGREADRLRKDWVEMRARAERAELGRAATLLDAAEAVGRMDYDQDSSDYGYDSYRDAWDGGVMDAAETLRRLAVEAPQPVAASEPGAEAPTVTPNPDGGVILHLPEITHLDTQVWAADIGLTREGLAALRAVLNGAEAPQPGTEAAADYQVWPLNRVLTEVRCGSEDWSWEEEWADLDQRHADTGYLAKLEQQIRENGITMPVLIGNDGRLWDGHHRLRIAVRLGIGYIPVEITPPVAVSQPAPTGGYEATTGHAITCLAVAGGTPDPECPCQTVAGGEETR
ncbi:hypothetical protein [Streptomyces sp. NPDC004376]